MIFEVGKFYRTRDGDKILILCTNAPGKYPILGHIVGKDELLRWCANGSYFIEGNQHKLDLISEWVEPKKPKLMAPAIYTTKFSGFWVSQELFTTEYEARATFHDSLIQWPARDAEGKPIFYSVKGE